MDDRTVTVFGGTGFLGRRIVEALMRRGCTVRIAARHPQRAQVASGNFRPIVVGVRDGLAVERAIDGAAAVVNAVRCVTRAATRSCAS